MLYRSDLRLSGLGIAAVLPFGCVSLAAFLMHHCFDPEFPVAPSPMVAGASVLVGLVFWFCERQESRAAADGVYEPIDVMIGPVDSLENTK